MYDKIQSLSLLVFKPCWLLMYPQGKPGLFNDLAPELGQNLSLCDDKCSRRK